MNRRRKRKYKTVTFKLSARQQESLEAYCRAHNTTPIKYIKNSIRKALSVSQKKNMHLLDEDLIHKGQIDLEDMISEIRKEEREKARFNFPKDLFS